MKRWLFSLFAVISTALWLVYQFTKAKAEKFKAQRDTARSAAESVRAANEAAKRVREAQNAQLQKNEEARKRRSEESERYTGRVDLSRLSDRVRDKD